MSRSALSVTWYWFRVNLARRITSYLAVVLLVGLIGGIAIGSLSAARRTKSSFDVFLASTNPSDMSVLLGAPNLTKKISHLPLVQRVAGAAFDLSASPKGHNGLPWPALVSGRVVALGSEGREFFSQDDVVVTDGRMANPKKADEFVMTAEAERLMGWHVGQTIAMVFYTNAQSGLPGFGTARVKPHFVLGMRLVGTVVLNNEVVLDEVDRYPAFMIFTPTLTGPLTKSAFDYINYSLQLKHGAHDVPAVEREIIRGLPRGTTYTFHVTSTLISQVDRSIQPEVIALGVFGLIAALAALVIASGLITRLVQGSEGDLVILRALGAGPTTVASASLLGVLAAVVVGAALATVVGVALTPLSPIGPASHVYPEKGIAFDWPVLSLGFAVLVVGLGATAVVLARRRTRRLVTRSRTLVVPTSSRVARLFAAMGLPLPAVVGVRFALEPGRERDTVPVRSALLGAVFAVMIVVTTVTFSSGLSTLVSHPALYGWNWDYAMTASYSVPPQSTRLLSTDPSVAAWSAYHYADAQIDGVTVPILLSSAHAAVSPPLLSGHEIDAANQIVLGAATMVQLHKRVGQSVSVTYGTPKDAPVYVPPTHLVIVGTATLPAVGTSLSLHTSMGTGAVVDTGVEPASMRKFLASPNPTLNGPSIVFIRVRAGVSSTTAVASLKKIAGVGNQSFQAVPNGAAGGESVYVLPVQYPAEIENYRSIGAAPALLALGVAAGAVVALGLTLMASVRRRRRELALLRTLGFTRRQLVATIACQASVAGLTGVVVGVPLGVALGRWLWTLFARSIYAVPEPTVPVITLVVIALSAFALANIVAAIPGRSAAQISTAQVLRGE